MKAARPSRHALPVATLALALAACSGNPSPTPAPTPACSKDYWVATIGSDDVDFLSLGFTAQARQPDETYASFGLELVSAQPVAGILSVLNALSSDYTAGYTEASDGTFLRYLAPDYSFTSIPYQATTIGGVLTFTQPPQTVVAIGDVHLDPFYDRSLFVSLQAAACPSRTSPRSSALLHARGLGLLDARPSATAPPRPSLRVVHRPWTGWSSKRRPCPSTTTRNANSESSRRLPCTASSWPSRSSRSYPLLENSSLLQTRCISSGPVPPPACRRPDQPSYGLVPCSNRQACKRQRSA